MTIYKKEFKQTWDDIQALKKRIKNDLATYIQSKNSDFTIQENDYTLQLHNKKTKATISATFPDTHIPLVLWVNAHKNSEDYKGFDWRYTSTSLEDFYEKKLKKYVET